MARDGGDMEFKLKSATLALLTLVTSLSACIERAAPCDNGTFDGEITQTYTGFDVYDVDGNYRSYPLGDEARAQFGKCRAFNGHLSGVASRKEGATNIAIDDSYFPNLESLGSIGTHDPWIKSDHLPLLTGWDHLTELGGVLGTVDRIEGFSQIRSIGTIEGLDVIGFNNLEHVGNLDVSNVPGLTSLETAGAIRLSYTAEVLQILPNLRSVEGDFAVIFSGLVELWLPGVRLVGGDFGVAGNDFLARFGGLGEDPVVLGSFYFYGNPDVTSSDVLDVVDVVDVGGEGVVCENMSPDLVDPCPEGFGWPIQPRWTGFTG
jgi:hypothetical protein